MVASIEKLNGPFLFGAERDGPEMLARIAVMKALNQRSQTATPAPQGNLPHFSDRSMI
jgi:hypothetical protein